MALAHVQAVHADENSADLIDLDFGSAVTSGNNIFVGGAAYATTPAATAVTDDGTNSYTRDVVTSTFGSGGGACAGYHAFNVTGGSNFTVTFDADASTGSDYHAMGAAEFTGSNCAVAATGSVSGSTGSFDVATSDLVTDADSIIYGFMAIDGVGPFTEGSVSGAYTLLGEDEAYNFLPYNFCRRTTIPVAAGTYTVDWDVNGKAFAGVGIAFKETAGAGRTTKNTRAWTHGINIGMGHRMPV